MYSLWFELSLAWSEARQEAKRKWIGDGAKWGATVGVGMKDAGADVSGDGVFFREDARGGGWDAAGSQADSVHTLHRKVK